MRRTILLGAIYLAAAATVVLAADNLQPLNVKTGLWQVTTTTSFENMGAKQTRTYTSCVTKENQKQYPFADRDNDCKYTVQSSTSTHMEVSGDCQDPGGEKAQFKIQLQVVDSENVEGSGYLTMAGQATMHGDYTGKGKWIAANCPAGMK